jgi:PAS domain S-box-containing protein
MGQRIRWFHDKVLLSAIGLVLASGVLGAGLLAYQYEQTMRAGERLTSTFAAVIDEQTSRSLQTMDQSLQLLSRAMPALQAEANAPAGRESALLQAQLRTLPFADYAMVLDAAGKVAFSSRAELQGKDMSDKDFATVFKTRPGSGLFVAAPMRDTGGQWLLPVARALTIDRHGYAGVLVATVKVAYFDRLWASLALDSGSSVGLLRSDGQMLMRSPVDSTAMGRSFAFSPLFQQYLPASPIGGYRITSTVDGSDRYTAYRTLSERPDLVVIIGRTIDAILAPWYRLARLMAGIWLIASLALLAMGAWLARQSAQRRRAEATSAALAQRLNMACEAAGLVLWDWDQRTDQWHVTPNFYTMLGYPVQPGPVSRAQWLSLMHPQDKDRRSKLPRPVATTPDQRFEDEIRIRHADGSYRWMRTTGQAKELGAQGQVLRMIGIRMDVTERVKAEQERRQMFERISDALVAISPDWTITHVNDRAAKLLRRTPQALIGKNVWAVFPDSDGYRFRAVYERCMASQNPEVFEEHYEPAGVWYESHIYPSPEGLSVYFRDITARKVSEAALRHAKEQAENLINGANAMVVALDARGHITIFNKAAQELTGYTMADMAGRNWFEVLVPRERYPQVHAEFERLSRGGMPTRFENPILTASGEERHIAWQNTVLRDGDRAAGVLSFGMDVTDRRRAERDLAESKEQFEVLARHSLQGISLVRKAHVVYVNPAYCAMLGRSAAEISRVSVLEMQQWVHPDDRAESIRRVQANMAGEDVSDVTEMRILTGQGQWRWIQFTSRVIQLSGQPALLGMQLDIHDRRLAEDALRASEERFRSAFDSSGIGMGLTALDGHWMQVNPALCRIVGYSAEELLQHTFMEMTHPDDLAADLAHTQDMVAGRIPHFTMEKRYRHRDGHLVWVNLTVALVRDAKGKPLHTVAQIEDIDRRKRLEQDLAESQDHLKATIASLPDAMFEVDLDGVYHDCHSPRPELLLRPASELLGRSLTDVMPADAAGTVMAALREAHGAGRSAGHQILLPLADGDHWFELSVTRKESQTGNTSRFIVLSRDVSERIRTLHALRTSEELMRQMAESVSQMFFLADLRDHRFLYVSPAVEAVLECSAAQMQADPRAWRQRIHPEDQQRVATTIQQGLPEGRYDVEFRVAATPDSVRWVHARSFPVHDAQGKPYRTAGVVEDITPRKVLEIREEQEHAILQYLASARPMPEILEKFVLSYEAMFPGMRGSILLLDPDGQHVRTGAAPHLPQGYSDAIDGAAIGPAAGSCGTAAFTGESVMVGDIGTDPRWNDYRALAFANDLRACWSVPIKSVDGQVLGTFAFYFDHPREPSPAETQAIEHGAQLASQALQRHFAAQALQRSEERYRTVVEWSPMGILIHQNSRIVFCNPSALEMHRASSAQEMLGRFAIELVHPDDRPRVEALARQVLQYRHSTPEIEIRCLQMDGNVIDLQTKAAPTLFDGAPAVQVVMFDITARRLAQEQLRASQQQLRQLSARVLAAQETERRRVAHELHDELGQSLTAIKINLQSQQRLVGGDSGTLFTENIRIVEQALQHVRGLALALRPSMLDDLGLVSALRWLTDQARQRHGMDIQLRVSDKVGRLAPDLETAVFRIVQEALTNIERHAAASKVEVTADIAQDGALEVRIRDDGAGFDVEAMRERASGGASMGVLGMAERATLAGGALSIDASPGKGCCITLRCPLADPALPG